VDRVHDERDEGRDGGKRPGQLPDAREAGGDGELDTRALGRGGGGVGNVTRSTASGTTAATTS
jgi:hypothetical protein